jgi:DNA-binding PadR family transcriptional regulator
MIPMPSPDAQRPGDLLPLTPQVFQILVALAGEDQHGYAIMQDVASRSGGRARLSPGTLYGTIRRMLEQGLIIELGERDRPRESRDDERRRYYRLTPFGRKVAKAEAARLADALEQARIHGLAPNRS